MIHSAQDRERLLRPQSHPHHSVAQGARRTDHRAYTDYIFDHNRGVKSVYEFLKERGGLAVLSDPNAELATREVLANGRSRPQINKEIRRKVDDDVLVLREDSRVPVILTIIQSVCALRNSPTRRSLMCLVSEMR